MCIKGQNYINYYQTQREIDKYIIIDSLNNKAIPLIDSISTYKHVFSQDCYKALQISCIEKDSARMEFWFLKCIEQGIPIWFIRTNEITECLFENGIYEKYKTSIDSIVNIYRLRLDENIKQIIDSLFTIDQYYTENVNKRPILFGIKWMKNSKKQFKIIREITLNYGFPGERLIGLPKPYSDSTYMSKNIKTNGPYLREWRAYFMILHYFSVKRKPDKDFEELMYKNLCTGQITPFMYSNIIDYIHRRNKNYNKYKDCDSKRQSIGLESIKIRLKIDSINDINRSKGTINQIIFIE